ncbi:MAG: hypothetical protein ACJ8AT_38595 [Hyalangium sp.]|uniref:hypothetical protein n=1 Tax=Hyalangium sp. TaxID=2028555 RepID=UPI0038998EC9
MMVHIYFAGLLALSLGASSKAQFVQPIELNLMQEPQRSAILANLPIGTQCELLQKVDSYWLRVRCKGLEGYVPAEHLGPEKPEVEKLLKTVKKSGLDARERLDFAARAVTLSVGHSRARAALKKYYLDYQFDRLPDDSDGAFAAERHIECSSPSKSNECLSDAFFPRSLFASRLLERRGSLFIGVGARESFLYVVRGTVRPSSIGTAGGISFVVHSQDFEDLDVRLIADVLGFKLASEPGNTVRYVSDGVRNFSRRKTGSRLELIEGEHQQVLVDLDNHVPPGEGGEIRADLRGDLLLDLLLVDDFDQDGRDDALVQVDNGGNHFPPGYLFASVSPEGKPVVSKVFHDSSTPPLIGETEGRLSFTFIDENGEKVFVLEKGEGRLVAERPYPVLETVFEYTAERLWKVAEDRATSPGETKQTLKYDLDEDGRPEIIECQGWERWHGLLCEIYRANRKLIGTIGGCKRVGVLPQKTRGMHDLVCDKNIVSRWNGTLYP